MSKRNRLSNVRILILTLETVLILGAFFVFKGRLDTEAAHSALNSGEETAFQRISFYVANKGQAFMIKAHRDVTVNPSKYYVFLPSCARNADIFVYYEFRDCLEILDGSGFNERIKNGDRLPNVELKKEYDMAFTDSDGSVMERTKVSFYNSDNTPSIFIDTLSGSMEYLDSDKGNSEKGKILILDSDGKTEYKGRLEEIKGHGNSTWQRAKKPYAFKLYKEENLFNMGSSKNWVLLSNSMDKSMARNSLIADAARDLNLPASPKMCYADIYLNGSYNGLYLLSTKTEIGKGRIDITDLDRMNKLVNIIPPAGSEKAESEGEGFSIRTGVKLEVLPDDITGGYLIEHDYGYKFKAVPSRFRTMSGDRYVVRSPAYAAIEEVEYIAGLFEELERKVENGEKLSDLIDMESFARIYVLDEFTRNEGAGVTSAYYYKDRDLADPLIHAGPVWDYDQCLGNTYYAVVNEPHSLNFCTDHVQSTLLFFNLYQKYSEFRESVMNYYRDELRPVFLKYSKAGLDSYLGPVLSNNDMNNVRWGNNDDAAYGSLAKAQEFIDERIKFLDRAWIDKEKIHVVRFDQGDLDRVLHIGILDGDTIRAFPDFVNTASDNSPQKVWYDMETGETVDRETKITQDMVIGRLLQ